MTDWALRDFLDRFDQWVERDEPDTDDQLVVMDWIHSLQTDPYRAAARRTELGPNVWFVDIPEANDDNFAVVSTYVVDPAEHTATCWNIATLRKPIVD